MAAVEQLSELVREACGDAVLDARIAIGELTVEVEPGAVTTVLATLRDHPELAFEQLIDLAGVDYSTYGTESQAPAVVEPGDGDVLRLAVAYHLLSLTHNHRIRVRARLDPERPGVDSAVGLWPVANWYEREAFDLYGIVFHGHPDLRRLLTDYGFIGHPFRKAFPISGHVEMRYDEEKRRVVYEPVSIEPRVLVPRVSRREGYRA